MFFSANPFEEGWYGGHKVCSIPLDFKNVTNSSAINCAPLSQTNCVANPHLANKDRRTVIKPTAVVLNIGKTSSHLE